jgi:hypothetical protein
MLWSTVMNRIYLISRVHLPIANGTFVVAVKPKATDIFFSTRLSSCYFTLHKKDYLNKRCTFWPRCITIHHCRFLAWVALVALSPHKVRTFDIFSTDCRKFKTTVFWCPSLAYYSYQISWNLLTGSTIEARRHSRTRAHTRTRTHTHTWAHRECGNNMSLLCLVL